jgi:hypothetical protein
MDHRMTVRYSLVTLLDLHPVLLSCFTRSWHYPTRVEGPAQMPLIGKRGAGSAARRAASGEQAANNQTLTATSEGWAVSRYT